MREELGMESCARVNKDMQRWTTRKEKEKTKPKQHVLDHMTKHALQRAKERGVSVKEVLEGRANVEQILTNDGRFITIIPKK